MMQRRVHDRFSLDKLSKHRVYTMTNASRFDFQWWQAKNCWRSIVSHFHEGARSISRSVFPIQAANKLIITRNDHIASGIPNLQDQKSLMLRWSLCSWRGTDRVAICFPYKGSWYFDYQKEQQYCYWPTRLTRPKIVDALLMLNFRMGQGAWGSLFAYEASQYPIYEWSQPIAKQITNDARPTIVDAPLTLILPWAYPQFVIIYFGIIYH